MGLAAAALTAFAAGAEELELRDLVRTGRYEDAVKLVAAQPAPEAVGLLAESLTQLGRYTETEVVLRQASERTGFRDWRRLGDTLVRLGRSDEARQAYAGAIRERTPDALLAALGVATLDRASGRLEEAKRGFYSLISAYNSRQELTSEELTAVGRACQLLGNDNPQLFKDALKAYDEAVAADPGALEPRRLLAELFLEKYDSTEARTAIQDVLEVNPNHPEALLVLARILHFDGSGESMDVLDQSLKLNPNLVSARTFRAQLLLELEDYPGALVEARRALDTNPEALEALSILAATHFLQGDEARFATIRDRVLAHNPRYADFFNTLADASVRNRLYREATELARTAVELDPQSWRGHGLEGLNLLRLGEIDLGRAKLETAFAGDPYNVWIKNTLDLLDTFPEYESVPSPRFELFIHGDEAALLGPYLSRLAEEAYDKLAERYRVKPEVPIRVEVFPSHADFSVRTVGLTGMGALGVCFGRVIAVDSPSAREQGTFNWGSTFWHELAHTFTLTATGHRVPRWLTEGLSVLEERRARQGWGDDVSPEFLRALGAGELLPLAKIHHGFVRPKSPAQIANSYYQASLIVELIEETYGFDKLLAVLGGYKTGRTTRELFETILEVDLEDFDREFFSYLEERFASAVVAFKDGEEEDTSVTTGVDDLAALAEAKPDDFRAQMRYGASLFADERFSEATRYLQRAKEIFPDFAAESSAYWMLAEIYQREDEPGKAADELRQMTAINETHYRAHLKLAGLLRELGERSEEAAVLERALYIYPLDPEPHARLAEIYVELGDPPAVVRERRALLALRPADRAQALYELASALHAAGEHAEARRQVLLALEIAPSFEKAQDLLLKMRRGVS